MFMMQLLEPPSWLFSVSTVLLVADFLHLVGQCPQWTPEICLVPVPYNSCICWGVIPIVIVYISQYTMIFIVLSSIRIEPFHDSFIVSLRWGEVIVQHSTGFGNYCLIIITQIHSSVKNTEALYQDTQCTFYYSPSMAQTIIEYQFVLCELCSSLSSGVWSHEVHRQGECLHPP